MLMLLVAVAGFAGAADAADAWWDSSWPTRQRVYINASLLSKDLEAFPVRITLPDGAAADDGRDLRAVSPDGQVLPVEVVSGTEFYVRVPRIAAARPGQYIDVYYGNPDAEPAPLASLWEDPYRLVMHLDGKLPEDVAVEGKVSLTPEGAEFTQEPGFLKVSGPPLEGVGDILTLSFRFRAQEGPALQNLASGLRQEPLDWFNFGLKMPDTVHTNAVSSGQTAPELNVPSLRPGEWHSAVVRYDARNHSRAICVDGVALQQDSALPGPLRVQELRIGRGVLHFEPWQFHGTLDEVRIAAAARSDAWLLAESASLSDANPFYVLGPAQEIGEPVPPPTSFALLAPADGFQWRKRAGVPLRWQPSAGADRYEVRVFADAAGKKPLAKIDAGPATEFVLPRDAADRAEVFWTVAASSASGETVSPEKRKLSFYDWSESVSKPPQMREKASLQPIKGLEIELQGHLRERVDKIVRNWFLTVPESSPAILQVFRDRDKRPVRDPLVPWAGEFAGKFLTAAQLNWRLTRDPALKDAVDAFVRDLIACQAQNGYLGPFPPEARLTGPNWDVWGHYHCMLGLMLYYEDTGYEPALDACRKMADLLFETFGPGGPSLTCDGSQGQMNMAVCHSLLMLYEKTGVQRYRELAEYIVHDAWNEPGAGQYLKSALEGKEVWEFPAHRWEALHDYQALPALYWLTGKEDYRRAYEHIWQSCAKGDRHNTGGFTSGEGCTGSPYNLGAIETCCTVAWTALSIDMLRLTGDSRVADEIEWSTLNSALGALPYSGRACAYNVPMDGTRTFGVELPWQAPKAGPDLNCCSVNAPRPLGMIAEWALMKGPEYLALNFYGPCAMTLPLSPDNRLTLTQETGYPADGRVRITLDLQQPARFTLALRIPRWSRNTAVRVNGELLSSSPAGAYLELDREWKSGDAIHLDLDFALRFWEGQQEVAGKTSVFRGPILLAYDARFNDLNPDQLPTLDPASIRLDLEKTDGPLAPWMLGTLTCGDASFKVTDLASAGQTGNHYRTWFPAKTTHAQPADPSWPFE